MLGVTFIDLVYLIIMRTQDETWRFLFEEFVLRNFVGLENVSYKTKME